MTNKLFSLALGAAALLALSSTAYASESVSARLKQPTVLSDHQNSAPANLMRLSEKQMDQITGELSVTRLAA